MGDEMTPEQYLEAILKEHTLSESSPEMEPIRQVREDIRQVLRGKYGSTPSLNEGGSKGKGTMIREAHDLDLFCYFPEGDTTAGDTLHEIYHDVADTLSGKYFVERGRSSLKVHTQEETESGAVRGRYLRVDVVPGRYIDEDSGDVNLFQNGGAKRSLKTNPLVQIEHIRKSGVRRAIRLAKLWNHRWQVGAKTFVLELLVVKVLERHENDPLPDQVTRVWETLRDKAGSISVKDPANPDGNDLSELLDSITRSRMADAARRALEAIENYGWPEVFGPTKSRSSQEKARALGAVAAHVASRNPTRPYYDDRPVA